MRLIVQFDRTDDGEVILIAYRKSKCFALMRLNGLRDTGRVAHPHVDFDAAIPATGRRKIREP